MEEDRKLHHYKLGSTFEQAIDLYLFDKKLRQLIFKAIQDIEISLRTKMIQVSFGTLSKLFCLFKDNRLKKQVAREFGLPQYTYLENWKRCITVLRNCCAHHARIWNRRFALKPQLPNRLPLAWITPTQKPIKLYHQLCTLLYLEQTITPCMDLKSSLFRLFADYPNIDLHAMGFPKHWQDEPLWR